MRNSDGDQLCLGCGAAEPTAVHQANGAPAANIKGPTLFLRENTTVKVRKGLNEQILHLKILEMEMPTDKNRRNNGIRKSPFGSRYRNTSFRPGNVSGCQNWRIILMRNMIFIYQIFLNIAKYYSTRHLLITKGK